MRRIIRLLLVGGLVAGAWVLLRELLGPQPAESPSPSPSDQADGGARATGAQAGDGARGNGAASLTKAELYREAQRLDVEGRSKMTKDELAEAIAKARRT